MIKQIINGQVRRTVSINATDADIALLEPLMAGAQQKWSLHGEGGTPANPAETNYIRIAVGKKGISSRRSASVLIPHLAPAKTFSDISAAVIAVWDEDFVSTVKCEYCTLVGASSRGA